MLKVRQPLCFQCLFPPVPIPAPGCPGNLDKTKPNSTVELYWADATEFFREGKSCSSVTKDLLYMSNL